MCRACSAVRAPTACPHAYACSPLTPNTNPKPPPHCNAFRCCEVTLATLKTLLTQVVWSDEQKVAPQSDTAGQRSAGFIDDDDEEEEVCCLAVFCGTLLRLPCCLLTATPAQSTPHTTQAHTPLLMQAVRERFNLVKCLEYSHKSLVAQQVDGLDVDEFIEQLESRWRFVDADQVGALLCLVLVFAGYPCFARERPFHRLEACLD